jgi:FkbM family methyltransferase
MSFEPNAFNYRILVANMSLNRLHHVECVNSALFSKPAHLSLGRADQQEIPLPIDPTGEFDGLAASNLGAYSFTENGSGIFSTEARTLDSYCLNDLALIKIDVQGADGEVIYGAIDTIRRCNPVIIFEWEKYLSGTFERTIESVMQLLDSLDYKVDILKTINEKQTDFIAHSRRAAWAPHHPSVQISHCDA